MWYCAAKIAHDAYAYQAEPVILVHEASYLWHEFTDKALEMRAYGNDHGRRQKADILDKHTHGFVALFLR